MNRAELLSALEEISPIDRLLDIAGPTERSRDQLKFLGARRHPAVQTAVGDTFCIYQKEDLTSALVLSLNQKWICRPTHLGLWLERKDDSTSVRVGGRYHPQWLQSFVAQAIILLGDGKAAKVAISSVCDTEAASTMAPVTIVGPMSEWVRLHELAMEEVHKLELLDEDLQRGIFWAPVSVSDSDDVELIQNHASAKYHRQQTRRRFYAAFGVRFAEALQENVPHHDVLDRLVREAMERAVAHARAGGSLT